MSPPRMLLYPSKGIGDRAAWFRDCDGNLLGIGQPIGPAVSVSPTPA